MGDGENLDGRVIAIAGVGGGLGPAVAARLGEAGAIVAGANRGQEEVDALGARARARRALGRARRSTSPTRTRWRAWRDGLVERFGRVDGLVHLVGGWRGGQPLHEEPLADWDLLHALLIRTVQLTTRAFHDQLAASRARALRPRLRQAGPAAEQRQRRLRGGEGGRRGLDARLRRRLRARRRDREHRRRRRAADAAMRAEDPGKAFPTFTPVEHVADAIAWLCSDGAGGDERPAPGAYDAVMATDGKGRGRRATAR